MAQGQMEGIYLFFIIFPESLPINYTTLKLATYIEEALGNTKYHHQGRGIQNTRVVSVLPDHCSTTNERDTSIFITFPEILPINYTTLKYVLPRRGIRSHKYHHQDSGIPNTRLMLVLLYHDSRTTE
jgi:hypothetical protein